MPELTNPYHALVSFQEALEAGEIELQPGELDANVYVHVDHPNGTPRLTYVRLHNGKVTSFVNLVPCDPVEGVPCFNIGYAVPRDFRNQGRARDLVQAAIAELSRGLARNGITTFYIEAIVGKDNVPSQHVAESTLSPDGIPGTDSLSGVSIYQYLRKVTTTPAL